jgi:hypothetical protein
MALLCSEANFKAVTSSLACEPLSKWDDKIGNNTEPDVPKYTNSKMYQKPADQSHSFSLDFSL